MPPALAHIAEGGGGTGRSFPWPRRPGRCPAVAFATVPATLATADPPAPVPAPQHNNLVPIISRKRELTHCYSVSSSPHCRVFYGQDGDDGFC